MTCTKKTPQTQNKNERTYEIAARRAGSRGLLEHGGDHLQARRAQVVSLKVQPPENGVALRLPGLQMRIPSESKNQTRRTDSFLLLVYSNYRETVGPSSINLKNLLKFRKKSPLFSFF